MAFNAGHSLTSCDKLTTSSSLPFSQKRFFHGKNLQFGELVINIPNMPGTSWQSSKCGRATWLENVKKIRLKLFADGYS